MQDPGACRLQGGTAKEFNQATDTVILHFITVDYILQLIYLLQIGGDVYIEN